MKLTCQIAAVNVACYTGRNFHRDNHSMKLLITGAWGMLGRNLTPALALMPNTTILTPTRAELDLLDKNNVLHYLKQTKPDMIIHLAAKVGGLQTRLEQPVDFLADNLQLGLNVALSALAVGIPQFLNISSTCIYQQLQALDQTTYPAQEENYALAKIAITRLCESISRQHHLAYKTIIPCNLFGPHDNFDAKSGHMIPAVIARLHHAKINKTPEVTIWGDGKMPCEFLYVSDLVDFILQAIARFSDLPEKTNVGLGRQHSVNEYYQFIRDAVGLHCRFVHDLTKPTRQTSGPLDIHLAKQFGWQPTVSTEKGIEKTYAYFLSLAS
jgi:GDP-L-fucose synthase